MDLDKLKALCDAATPGPWVAITYHSVNDVKLDGGFLWVDREDDPFNGRRVGDVWQLVDDGQATTGLPGSVEVSAADAEFIAAAREALPELIDENATLEECNSSLMDTLGEKEAENARLRGLLDRAQKDLAR